jgi:hypothetical protein
MSRLRKGDSVVVKEGVSDVDFDVEIGGWQGRIIEIAPAGNQETVLVAWDSITLRNMPGWMIARCEEEGLDWAVYGVEASQVEKVDSRDTEADVERAVEEIARRYNWVWLGEEGKRINRILRGVDPDDLTALVHRWENHLKEHLHFPFDAEVFETHGRGPLQVGTRVNVKRISLVEAFHGVIVEVRRQRKRYDFPLCDLEVVDESSPNHQLVRDYRIWFANR